MVIVEKVCEMGESIKFKMVTNLKHTAILRENSEFNGISIRKQALYANRDQR